MLVADILQQALIVIRFEIPSTSDDQLGVELSLSHVGSESPDLSSVLLRRVKYQVLVTDLPVLDAVWLGVAVYGAHRGQLGRWRRVAVLHPIKRIPPASGRHVDLQDRFRTDGLAEAKELVGTEMVRVISTPEYIARPPALIARADPVPPVIVLAGRTAQAHIRDFQLTVRLDSVQPQAVVIRDRRIFAYPYAVVNAPSGNLNHMTEQSGRDLKANVIGKKSYKILRHVASPQGAGVIHRPPVYRPATYGSMDLLRGHCRFDSATGYGWVLGVSS